VVSVGVDVPGTGWKKNRKTVVVCVYVAFIDRLKCSSKLLLVHQL